MLSAAQRLLNGKLLRNAFDKTIKASQPKMIVRELPKPAVQAGRQAAGNRLRLTQL